jgi:uncharacterized membrane protein YobD (UPF0266 family)
VVLFDILSFRGGVDAKAQQMILIFTSMIIGALSVYFLFKSNRGRMIFVLLISILMCAVGWWLIGYIGMGVLMFTLAVVGKLSMKSIVVTFSETGILYPSMFYKKNIPWSEVSNCLIKDNVLTIDLKSNKLMQFTLQEAENPELNEQEFNAFVRACLKEES